MAKTKKIKEDYQELSKKGKKLESLIKLSKTIRDNEKRAPINFNDFLYNVSKNPACTLRDVFQMFHDMVHHYVPDPIQDKGQRGSSFTQHDYTKLFVNGCDNPFFSDTLFGNRFMKLINGFRKGTQKNNIFLFEGPPGSGKSTFLNNLMQKLEDYAKTEAGTTYKIYWRIDIDELGGKEKFMGRNPGLAQEISPTGNGHGRPGQFPGMRPNLPDKYLEFSCPNHDHPILLIPKAYRRQFLDELIVDGEFKKKLFNDKQYEWVFKDVPCTICSSLYNELLDQLHDPLQVFDMVYVRKNYFSRQHGEGISVFNPGDMPIKNYLKNPIIEHLLSMLFGNDDIRFQYSYLAKTNNGVLALMDIKENNIHRLQNFHGIISDGVHKVALAEEYIKTLFLGLVNPGDKKHYANIPSFKDRIINVQIPYILDYKTEVEIFRNKFGHNLEQRFLPRVLENMAKIIVSSRLNSESSALKNWIAQPARYTKFMDKNMLLLKMEIYSGNLPNWLSDEDAEGLDDELRKTLMEDSESEGGKGISGRQSLILMNTLLSKSAYKGKLITMDMLKKFFMEKEQKQHIAVNFLEALEGLYDYNVLQEVKEAIYYYNKEQLSRDIQNYMFAINFDAGSTKTNDYTGDKIDITEEFFDNFEIIFMGKNSSKDQRLNFRKDMHSEYVRKTLFHEMQVEDKKMTDTEQFQKLFDKYTRNLKENALAPYVNNDNFRMAIKDYGLESFHAYSDKLKRDVTHLINNLMNNYKYTEEGARQICFYVLDKKLPDKY